MKANGLESLTDCTIDEREEMRKNSVKHVHISSCIIYSKKNSHLEPFSSDKPVDEREEMRKNSKHVPISKCIIPNSKYLSTEKNSQEHLHRLGEMPG